MPTLIEERRVRLELTDLQRRVVLPRTIGQDGYIVPPARTPGLHLSGLLRFLADRSHIKAYAEDAANESSEERGVCPLRWALGQAVEEFMASIHAGTGMLWAPGEITRPVIMTPDGLSASDDGEPVVDEFKFRRAKRFRSAENLLSKWIFMQQGLGYCSGYDLSLVRWHIISAFEFPDPDYTTYLVRFNPDEIHRMRKTISVNRQPAIDSGYSEQ